jgi:hypothetical protein
MAWVFTATCARVSVELRVIPHARARSSGVNSHLAVIPDANAGHVRGQ